MSKGRMEAFSDGVMAILITIMVLQLVPPNGVSLGALRPLLPIFLSYVLSFVILGIYWNNHHHLLQAVRQVNGNILWANMHLLFWLSLFPFGTAWMGENPNAAWPVALYGVILLCAALAYYVLAHLLIKLHGRDSVLARALGMDLKGILSPVLYLLAIPAAFLATWISLGLYVLVAVIWLAPDRRIEKRMANTD